MIKMKLKIMIMALLLVSAVGIGSAVNRLPATEFVGDVDMGDNWITNAKIENPGIYNVKDYGAAGDDITDDTAAIRAAAAAAAAWTDAHPAGQVGIVYFPPGTYKISDDIGNYNWATNCNYYGMVHGWNRFSESSAVTINVTHSDDYAMTLRSGQHVENLRFKYVHSNYDTPTEYPATIYIRGHSNVVRGCSFRDTYIAIKWAESGAGWATGGGDFIEDCTISGFYRGLLIDNTIEITYISNILMTITSDGQTFRNANFIGIESLDTDAAFITNVFQFGGHTFFKKASSSSGSGLAHYITNCRAESTRIAFNLLNGTSVCITGGSYSNIASGGHLVYLDASACSLTMQGCGLSHFSTVTDNFAVYIANGATNKRIMISDSRLQSVSNDIIRVSGKAVVTITDNIFDGGLKPIYVFGDGTDNFYIYNNIAYGAIANFTNGATNATNYRWDDLTYVA